MLRIIISFIITVMTAGLMHAEGISYAAKDWEIKNIPASNNKDDRTVYIFKNYAQVLTFIIKTTSGYMKQPHKIKMQFSLPPGTELMETVSREKQPCVLSGGKNEPAVEFTISSRTLQDIKKRESEWRNFQAAIRLPENCPENWKLGIKLYVDGKFVKTCEWPVNSKASKMKGSTLKSIRLGLWDYGIYAFNTSAPAILNFYKRIGINYCQHRLKNVDCRDKSFIFGGAVHHAFFYNKEYPNIDNKGKLQTGNFCDPQAVIELGPEIISRAIDEMGKRVQNGSGIATIDYEPTGNYGFSKLSIKAFLKKYNFSSGQFEKFMNAYAKEKYSIYKNQDPEIQAVYTKWIEFNSWQTQEYTGAIAKAFRKKFPGAKFELTCRNLVGTQDLAVRVIGNNNSSMAKYLDAIMPQIYCGYGSAAAKFAALEARKWKQTLQSLNPKCKLYPLLMIRYSGANVRNSPERIRQQTIGAIAEGADGVIYYYTQQLDARYWEQIAQLTNDLAMVEDYYLKGTRIDAQFKPVNMLKSSTEINRWPGYNVDIANPDWHYTAHSLNGKVLLTLFNYSDNEMLFNFTENKRLRIDKILHGGKYALKPGMTSFLVPARETAFVTLTEN